MRQRTLRPRRERSAERGATMVEYAILMAVNGALLIGSLTVFRGALENVFNATAAIF